MVRIEHIDHRDFEVARRIHAILVRAHAQEAGLHRVGNIVALELTVEDIQSGNECYLGASREQALLGAVSLEPDDEPNQILVASLVVHPEQQRRGIARSLMLKALEGSDHVAFAVATTVLNIPALSLYRSLGFVEYRYGTIGPEKLGLVKLRRARARCISDPS
jgi:ribosomal protein S18 acetylase RimI-like enzyme